MFQKAKKLQLNWKNWKIVGWLKKNTMQANLIRACSRWKILLQWHYSLKRFFLQATNVTYAPSHLPFWNIHKLIYILNFRKISKTVLFVHEHCTWWLRMQLCLIASVMFCMWFVFVVAFFAFWYVSRIFPPTIMLSLSSFKRLNNHMTVNLFICPLILHAPSLSNGFDGVSVMACRYHHLSNCLSLCCPWCFQYSCEV